MKLTVRFWLLFPFAGFVVASLLQTHLVQAEGLRLTWDADPSCGTAAAVQLEVERRVTHPPARPFEARVVLRATDGGTVAELSVGAGTRTLTAPTCGELTSAIIVILALAVDAVTDSDPSLPENAPESDPLADAPSRVGNQHVASSNGASAVVGRRQQTPSASSAAPAEQALMKGSVEHRGHSAQLSFVIHALAELGALPEPSLGISLGGRWGTLSTFAELSALVVAPRRADLSAEPDAGADGFLASSTASGCGVPVRSLPVAGCLGVEAGMLWARGFGVDVVRTRRAPWLALSPRLVALLITEPNWGLESSVGVALPVSRPRFTLDGLGLVHQPARVSVKWMLGVSFR